MYLFFSELKHKVKQMPTYIQTHAYTHPWGRESKRKRERAQYKLCSLANLTDITKTISEVPEAILKLFELFLFPKNDEGCDAFSRHAVLKIILYNSPGHPKPRNENQEGLLLAGGQGDRTNVKCKPVMEVSTAVSWFTLCQTSHRDSPPGFAMFLVQRVGKQKTT